MCNATLWRSFRCWSSVAQPFDDRPIPRKPIGPTDFQIIPLHRLPPANTVGIVNRGDQRLSFSYWDGQSAWRSLSLDAQASTDISCKTHLVPSLLSIMTERKTSRSRLKRAAFIGWAGLRPRVSGNWPATR